MEFSNALDSLDIYSQINNLWNKNVDRLIFAHLKINSIRYKISMLSDIVAKKIDVFCISDTKLDESFMYSNFLIPGYSIPFRRDRTTSGGGLLLYVRSDISSKELKYFDLECIFIELNIFRRKWLVVCFYNHNKIQISNQLDILSNCLNRYLTDYDNVILLGYFNSEMIENPMIEFCENFNLKNLVKTHTCFKNIESPTCIDLILTNKANSFQNIESPTCIDLILTNKANSFQNIESPTCIDLILTNKANSFQNIESPTCIDLILTNKANSFQNIESPTCIDLILTNKANSFQNTLALETGLSDFHKMVATVLKTKCMKKPPKIILYRNYKRYSNDNFMHDLLRLLGPIDLNNLLCDDFDNIVLPLIA